MKRDVQIRDKAKSQLKKAIRILVNIRRGYANQKGGEYGSAS